MSKSVFFDCFPTTAERTCRRRSTETGAWSSRDTCRRATLGREVGSHRAFGRDSSRLDVMEIHCLVRMTFNFPWKYTDLF